MNALAALKARLLEVDDLNGAANVLRWDLATYMPPGGAPARGRQTATLARLAHERFVDAPLAFILEDVLGPSIEKVFLFFICVSMFCCGLITMATNARVVWAMARDRRLPGHQLLSRVPKATGGPSWATVLVAVAPMVPLVYVRSNTDALIDMFTAGTLMPAITYTGTVLLYAAVASRLRPEPGYFHLGRWQRLVVTGAPVWLAYELIVLLGPDLFRAAQGYE